MDQVPVGGRLVKEGRRKEGSTEYDCIKRFPFVFEPNVIKVGSKTVEGFSIWTCSVQFIGVGGMQDQIPVSIFESVI